MTTPNRIRVVIVDDEPLARRRVRRLLAMEPDMEVVQECGNGLDALNAIAELRPDLVLMDVQMPVVNGTQVVQALEGDLPIIVFMTAYDRYALEAFEVNAIDYLLKPFEDKRFQETLRRVRTNARVPSNDDHRNMLKAALRGAPHSNRLVVRHAGKYELVHTDTVEFAESAGNYLKLHMGDKIRMYRGSIQSLLSRVNPDEFVRVHRSIVVNAAHIRTVEPWRKTDFLLTLSSGAQIFTSRFYRSHVASLLKR